VVIDFGSKIFVSDDIMIRQVGGESVVLDLSTERYLGLDEVGTRMWQALVASETIEAAYESLLGEFEVEPEQLRHDLDEYVQQLLRLGLVHVGHQR
jgi:coenzyme PQQ synthesis protein D (PqqD)